MPYNLLSQPIRKFIRDQKWESLRPIQAASIERIMNTDYNYILASRTASGKTEAAFLPLLSKLDFTQPGVQILYISPLIALINDQFYRVEKLCQYLNIDVTKWHGEANITLKRKLLSNPNGVVLITPESIEAMFVNNPLNIKKLFFNLQYIVIDELHYFLNSVRGLQLQSLISRLKNKTTCKLKIIGLSATIGDYDIAKRFAGGIDATKVLLDKTKKDVIVAFKYFNKDDDKNTVLMLNDIYSEVRFSNVLLFPNARRRVEEIAISLKNKDKSINVFTHHSAISKDLREYVEFFAKNNQNQNFCICCTSTLELGIDIGNIDKIIQIDATYSVSSLIQRLGRSGRRENDKGNLLVYSTSEGSLLQSLACWLLYKEGFIESIRFLDKPYDILLHQTISIIREYGELSKPQLIEHLTNNIAFNKIQSEEIDDLLNELIKQDILEEIEYKIILGLNGEKIVNKDFYSVFQVPPMMKVFHHGFVIGEIEVSTMLSAGETILLAAKLWEIIDIDNNFSQVTVKRSFSGRANYSGNPGEVHQRIREKMLTIIYDSTTYSELDNESVNKINNIRDFFSKLCIKDVEKERIIINKGHKVELFLFTSTIIERSFLFILKMLDIQYCIKNPDFSSFELNITIADTHTIIEKIKNLTLEIDTHLNKFLDENPDFINISKFGKYLPLKYQVELIKQCYFDFTALRQFLNNTMFIISDL